MELLTKYISIDEFNQYFGDNLESRFDTREEALAFLIRLEDRVETFINANFNKNIDIMYPTFTNYQKEHYKKALLEQAMYIIHNGDTSVDSGVDLQKGKIISRGTLRDIAIAENARQHLILCGLWSRHIKGAKIMGFNIR